MSARKRKAQSYLEELFPDNDFYKLTRSHQEPPRKKPMQRFQPDPTSFAVDHNRALNEYHELARKQEQECMICCESICIMDFPTTHHESESQYLHLDEVCLKCWKVHLRTQVETKSTDQIKCAQCSVLLAEPEIRKLAESATYDK